MASQGPLGAGTGADDAGTGSVAWSNPSNVTASDNTYATAAISSGNNSHYLKATNFGFSIPAGSTILGITVEWEVVEGAPFPFVTSDVAARIVKGGVIGATDRSNGTTWGSTDVYLSHGGAADLWGDTWTVADINDATFGAAVSAQSIFGPSTAKVDHCRITVTYTPPLSPWITRLVTGVGIDAPPYPGSVQIRSAMPPPVTMKMTGRALVARGEDAPPTAEQGRSIRVRPALIPNPPSQSPAKAIGRREELQPAPGFSWIKKTAPGVAQPSQPAGRVMIARGDDHPIYPGAVSFMSRVEFETPPPRRTLIARGEDAKPFEGLVAFALRSFGIPAPPATRLIVSPAEGPPVEQGRVSWVPEAPIAPPLPTTPKMVIARGWELPPDDGLARIMHATGLTNQLPPRLILSNPEPQRQDIGSAMVRSGPASPLVQQQRPGRAYVVQAEYPLAELLAGRAWWTRPKDVPTGLAGHIKKSRVPRIYQDQLARIERNRQARIARWPG